MKNMLMTQTPKYSDQQIVESILNNDQTIIQHFFFKECKPMFEYIAHAVFFKGKNLTGLLEKL